jgi:uncharacterized protein (DUF3084 family)
MATTKAQSHEDAIAAQMRDAKVKLEQFAANAKGKGAQAQAAAIESLNTAKQYIDQKVQDLKTTSEQYRSRAKADIAADVATFKASVDKLAGSFKG